MVMLLELWIVAMAVTLPAFVLVASAQRTVRTVGAWWWRGRQTAPAPRRAVVGAAVRRSASADTRAA